MPELYSQVLDLKEKDVFLETEVNDTRYFSVTGIPSTLSYGKHPFSITFNDPEGQPLLKNLSNIVFEFVDSRGTVVFSDLLDIEELSGAGNGVLWIKKDPLRTAAEIADGPLYLYVMGELDGDEIPEQWKGIYNVRSTFIFDARKDYPNTSNLVLKNPLGIQTNLNISESIEFDTADSVFKRSFINVSLTNLDTDGGKIESVELAYNEKSASNDEYEVITRYPLTSGSYEITDQSKISGLNPITNTSKIITPKQFRRDTSVRFRLRFVNPAGQLAQYLDKDRQGEVVEVTSSFITFEGSPFFIERGDNLLRGSMFTGNAVGKGFEQSGKNSAFLKTVDYEGFISASVGSGSAGILFYSGSVLTSSGDNYNGVGLELHGGKGSGSFRFSTNPNLLEITANTFFVGNENSQFISGSGGNIEISSSDFHLTPEGQVSASTILLGDKSAGQFLQFVNDTLTVQGSITADSIRTPASIGGQPSTDQNASSSISAGGFATFKSASIGGFIISPNDISASGLVLKSSGQITGSTTLIGDKGAGQFLQFVDDSLTVQGDITANSIRTPASIGGNPSTLSNASASIDSQGFAKFVSASIGGFKVSETEISSSGLVFKSGGEMTGSSTLIGNKTGGNFLQFVDNTLTVQGDITANAIRTPATIGGVASTDSNASASITSDGLATFKSGSIAGWKIFGNILSGSNASLDSAGAALYKSDQGPNTDDSAAFDQLRDEYFIDFTPADQGNTTNYYVKFGPNFSVDSTGTLFASGAVFEGTVSASQGELGGFVIDENSLSGTNLFLSGSPLAGGIHDDKYMFISTSKFNVKENGDITASAANITGDITANTITANTAGTIANFTINSSEIKSSNNNLRLKSSGQITGSQVDFTGGTIGGFELSSTQINDTSDSLVLKSNGQITGSKVLFDGGEVGGFTINNHSLTTTGVEINDSTQGLFISSSDFNVTHDGVITGSQVLFTGGKIAGFDISGTKLQQGTSFHLDGNSSADYFISSSKFQVTPTGDVSGSQVLFTGGKIGGFTLSNTEISASGLLLQSSGKISGSQVFFTGGTIGGFTITDNVLRNANNTVALSSVLPGLRIKDNGGTDRVVVKSGSLSTVGGGTQYIKNQSFEDDSISAGRNFVSTINSWSFSEGGGVNISLTDRSSYPDDDKAVSGDVTLDVVVPAGSGNYSSNNTYELSQIITASVAEGDTISFSSVARFSSSFGGRGKDRALGPQYFRLEYSGSGTNGFVPFLPEANFTASNGYGEYFLGSGQYSSFGASADLPSAASFIKVVITGSINDDTGFTIEKSLFAGDKGTVNSDLKGKKFTKQVKGSTTAEHPETEITFDNFSVRSNTRKVEVTQEGILIYNSEDSFFKMTGAGIEIRGGSGVASFGQAINRESFTNDSQVAGTLGAPSLQPYTADPEDIGTTASDGNVAEFAKGNHVHRLEFDTINSVLSGQTLTNVFNGTFGSSAGTLITGSFTAASSSFSTRVSNLEGLDVDDDLGIAGDIGTGTINLDNQSLTLIGGTGITTTGSNQAITINSSDSQIVHDNLSGFVADEHIDHGNVSITAGSGLTGGGNITTTRTVNVGQGTGITVGTDAISTNDSEIVHDNLSGFVANEHIDHSSVSITAGSGLTGGGNITTTRTINIGSGTGITVNADAIETNDSEIVHDNLSGFVANEHINHSSVTLTAGTGLTGGGDITTNRTFAIDFTDSDFKSAVSGSLGSNASLIRSLTAVGITGSFTAASSSFSSRITTIEAIDTDDDLTIAGDTGGNLSINMDSETLTIAGGTGIDTSGNTNTITVTTNDSEIVHDNLSGFVASEHIDHSTVSIIAGDGLTGGGTIAANRTLNIGAGTGIDVAADAISVDVSDFMSNGSNNRIVTATGTDAMNAEANLTFNGTTLSGTSATASFGHVVIQSPGDALELRSSGPVNTAGNTVSIDFTTNVYPTAGRNAYIDASQDSSNRGKLTIGTYGTVGGSTAFYDILQIHAQDGNAVISGSSISTGSFGRVEVVDKIARTGDPDTHIYFSDDDINIQVGGVNFIDLTQDTTSEITFNEGAANLDFRAEGDSDTHLLFVDASTNKVGIGTDAPDYKLDVDGSMGINEYIYHNGDNDTYLRFAPNLVNLVAGGKSAIKYEASSGKIILNNTNENVDVHIMAEDNTELLATDAANNRVGINTTTPGVALEVVGSISGSSTSTGSFGFVEAADDVAGKRIVAYSNYGGAGFETSLKDNQLLFGYNGDEDAYGVFVMGSTSIDIKTNTGANPLLRLDKTTGDIIVWNGNVSASGDFLGSSSSTGSFGTIQTTTGTIPTLFGNTTINDISITSDSSHRTISKGGSAGALTIKNTGQNHDIRFNVNSGGSDTKVLEIDGLTKATLPGSDNAMNLGASGTRWANVHATNFTAHDGNLLITGSSSAPTLTFNRAGEGSADIFLNSAGSGLIVDSGVPIQLDYTTFLSVEKEGTEFWRFTGNGGLAFGDSSSTTSVLTIKSDSNSPISFEKSSNRQNYLEFKKTSGNLTQPWLIGVGTDSTGTEFRVKNGSTTALTIASGSGNATFGGNISGSSTSTGSFGSLSLAGKVQSNLRLAGSNILYFGDDNNYIQDVGSYVKLRIADSHYFAIHNDSGDTERFRLTDDGKVGIGKTPAQPLDVKADASSAVGLQISYRAAGDARSILRLNNNATSWDFNAVDSSLSIQHSTDGTALTLSNGLDATFGGNISGSSSSTGSFGRVEASNISGTNTGDVTLDGSYDYITISNQVITRNQVNLTTDVTGTLPVANGGIGATSLNNLITLGTHTTGNYVASLVAGTGIDLANNSGETASPTVSVDVSDFMTNGSDNRIVTTTGTDAMNAEANLTFDGSNLAGGSGINFEITSSDGNNNSVALASMAGRLKFGNEYSDSARGPNKISTYDDGGAWVGGFGVHNGVVSYYTGNNHKWYKSNSQTSFTEVMGLDSSGNLTIGGTVDGRDLATDGAKLDGIASGADVGTITGVTAGSGLTGGGSSGGVTLNVGAGTGIDVAADAISVDVSDFMSNGSNNRVLTATGTDAINAEANLIFDGTNLLMGLTSAVADDIGHVTPKIQVEGTDKHSAISIIRNGNSISPPYLMFGKTRGTSVGSDTIVQDGDVLGAIRWNGADGVDRKSYGAEITAEVDGTPGSDDMPGRLIFKTTSDGASTSTERMRIDSLGNVIFQSDNAKISGSLTSTGSFGVVHAEGIRGLNGTYGGTLFVPEQLALGNDTDTMIRKYTSNVLEFRMGGQDLIRFDGNNGKVIVENANLEPQDDDTRNLGASDKRWSDIFAVQTTTGGVFETGLRTEKIGDNPTGTIVSWRGDGLVPCDSNEDELVMGVIKEGKDEPIVMGAEPVLVTGKVDIGDYIVTSDKIGHGKSVKRGYLLKKDLFGKVIAQALEPSDDSDSCLIKCMIRKM